VSGKVTLDGQPVTSGQVSYVPLDEKAAAAGMSAGSIDSNGGYKIFTAGKEGAPLGRYKVTVTPSMVPTGDPKAPTTPYSRKYSNFKETPLEKEVVNGPAPGAYDLQLTK
jgi:hypothetical protein